MNRLIYSLKKYRVSLSIVTLVLVLSGYIAYREPSTSSVRPTMNQGRIYQSEGKLQSRVKQSELTILKSKQPQVQKPYTKQPNDNNTTTVNNKSDQIHKDLSQVNTPQINIHGADTHAATSPGVDTGKIDTSGKVDTNDLRKGIQLVLGESSKQIRPTAADFPSPVMGPVLRTLGNYYSEALQSYAYHAGVDFAEPEGTVIRATHAGKVVFAGNDPMLGQKVTIDCGDGWTVSYGGLDNLRVQVGQFVNIHTALGQVSLFSGGEGGDRPHLHYELFYGDQPQEPMPRAPIAN